MDDFASGLRNWLMEEGCAVVGFADLTGVPEAVRLALPRAVVVGMALDSAVIDGIRQGPTKAYFDLYTQTNAALDRLGEMARSKLAESGFNAEFRPSTIRDPKTFDRATLSVGFSHKMAATRAGLGWIGKCALLVTPEYGSAIRFATILTDAELPTGLPISQSRCGHCCCCVEACPAHAPSGKNWNAGLHREDFFDAFACFNSIVNSGRNLGTVCGMCIPVCPWTERYLRKSHGA